MNYYNIPQQQQSSIPNNSYQPRNTSYHPQPPNTTKIYIGQLPLEILDSDIYNAFNGLAELNDVKIVKGNAAGSFNRSCYAFVNVKGNEQMASDAIAKLSNIHPTWKVNLKSQYDRMAGSRGGPRDFHHQPPHQQHGYQHNPYGGNRDYHHQDMRQQHSNYPSHHSNSMYGSRQPYPSYHGGHGMSRDMGYEQQKSTERGVKTAKILVREIWIGGIPEGMDENNMREIAGQFGMVEVMEIFAKFAFIKFKLVSDATNAFEKASRMHQLFGKPPGFRIFFSDPEKRTGVVSNYYEFEKQGVYLPIMFLGFPPITSAEVEEGIIRSVCDKFGPITNIYVRKSNSPQIRSYALVTYDSVMTAMNAKRELSKRKELLGDKRVEVAVLLDEEPILKGRNLEYTMQKFQTSNFEHKKPMGGFKPGYGGSGMGGYGGQPSNAPIQPFGNYPGYMPVNPMMMNMPHQPMNIMSSFYGGPTSVQMNPPTGHNPLPFSSQNEPDRNLASYPGSTTVSNDPAVTQLIRDAFNTSNEPKDTKDVHDSKDPDWSGFIIRNRQHRVAVDGFAKSEKFNFEDSMINVSFILKLSELKLNTKKHILVLEPSNPMYRKTFNEYIDYFRNKASAGISIGYKEVLFLLPKCKESDEILDIKDDEILVIVEDISAYYQLKDKFEKADD